MADSASKITYLSMPLIDLSAEREFPGSVYLCIHHKLVKFRNKGDKIDAEAFNRLVYNHVKFVFIEESERQAFQQWVENNEKQEQKETAQAADNPEAQPIIDAVQEQRRAMMDIFADPKDDKQVKAAIDISKKMVSEFLRKPFAINNIQALQKHSKGIMDHSVNVSVLSVFLGLRMGYSHQLILENLALGGLFHDIGKILIEPQAEGEGMSDEDGGNARMEEHPRRGRELLEKNKDIANEVNLIVGQHHEFLDGSGYPAKLKGLAVYDLARLVAIANLYDNFISESVAESMKDKALEAIERLETNFEGKLEPKKLEKAIKILRYSFL